MKRSKLSLQKFRVSKITNMNSIIGGTNADDGDGGTNTNGNKDKKGCIWDSAIVLPDYLIPDKDEIQN